jgi:hypothetical protein
MQNVVNFDINDLYRAFQFVRSPELRRASEGRDIGSIRSNLLCKNLRDISEDKIFAYASWAITTVGDQDDFMYFLPRILELSSLGSQKYSLQPHYISSKILLSHWPDWTDEQNSSVSLLYKKSFLNSLDDLLHGATWSWLYGMTALDIEIDGLLEEWGLRMSLPSTLQLSSFLIECSDGNKINLRTLQERFSDSSPRFIGKIYKWIKNLEVKKIIKHHEDMASDNEYKEIIASAIGITLA